KLWAEAALAAGPRSLLPWLDLRLAYNTGAAFSLLAGEGGWQRWLFLALALGATVLLVAWLRRLAPDQRASAAGIACLLGGAWGNAADRILRGRVVDYLDLHFPAASCPPLFYPRLHPDGPACHWPAFNLADATITVGVLLLLIGGLRARAPRGGGDRPL
ncbi:MAG: signal peptidase II, partial [Gammaproteobacteria bacterium]